MNSFATDLAKRRPFRSASVHSASVHTLTFPVRSSSRSHVRPAAARAGDANGSRRMLALAQVIDGKARGEAAASCGMDR